jgi:hypothetical protein
MILGPPALWRHHRCKEENDNSQERLEKLRDRTNELPLISHCLERENERHESLAKIVAGIL